ncbi:zonular occludens toxin domain-containing protein [Vibrio cyclitrophicus]
MMTLITGTPGSGKTLNTIKNVYEEIQKKPFFEKKAEDGIIEKYKRNVYCCNITGIDTEKSGFKILEEPKKWHELPAGSVLIIDEASDFYPTSKKFGEELEEDVAKLRIHRHFGIDIYYITQQPGLINKNIRILCGLHRHYQRNFGGGSTVCYENNAVFDTDSKFLRFAEQNGAQKSIIKLDKKYFGFYKSTEIDTHKSRLPWKSLMKYIFIPLILLVCTIVYFVSFLSDKQNAYQDSSTQIESSQSDSSIKGLGFSSSKKHVSKEEYQESLKPRLPFVQETAPIFDEVYRPVTYPKIKGCFKKTGEDSSCECYTQQSTIYKVPISICLEYLVGNRRFDYAKADKN